MPTGFLGHPMTGRVCSDVITYSVLGQHFARAAGLYLWDSVNIIITSHVLTAQLSLTDGPVFTSWWIWKLIENPGETLRLDPGPHQTQGAS